MIMQMRTYQTRLHIDDSADHILSFYAELFSQVEHHLFKAKVLQTDPNTCKKEFLKRFGITGRQYNACRITLQGKIESIKERRHLQIAELENKIKVLEIKVKKIRNPATAHQKKRHLTCLKDKLESLKADRDQNIIRLCFGSKKLFHAQFALEENGFSNHEEWRAVWQEERKSEFFVLGSKDELSGNQSCTAFLEQDGTLSLRLRLPNSFALNSYLLLPAVKFAYGHKEILALFLVGKPSLTALSEMRRDGTSLLALKFPPLP